MEKNKCATCLHNTGDCRYKVGYCTIYNKYTPIKDVSKMKYPRQCPNCIHSMNNNSTCSPCTKVPCGVDYEAFEPVIPLGGKTGEVKAIKFDDNKPRMSLVPPRALLQVAAAMTYGAKKYSADNYLQGGFTTRRLIDAALRHMNAHLQGEDTDESGHSHLSHCAASVLMLMEAIAVGKISDDRYKKE